MRKARIASVIFAAGYGSRIRDYSGNKILLPLVPGSDPYRGACPIFSEIIKNLPTGPKALVVHHRKEEVIKATRDLGVLYCDQPVPNGTGGALIAAQDFLEDIDQENLIITMGDVPFVRASTYQKLLSHLSYQDLVVLGFKPRNRAQYGVLEIENEAVKRIIEWRYWREYPGEMQSRFEICNSGIYAANRAILLEYLERLKQIPHQVEKERDGRIVVVEEYFITDLVELLNNDGLRVGFALAVQEHEVMGIDTHEDLIVAQGIFAKKGRAVKRL
jgi:bifunctional UDP-N-acetylglucosamine pyrophosphorylase/glucosamine-1-phosphate N-acetyltransferase